MADATEPDADRDDTAIDSASADASADAYADGSPIDTARDGDIIPEAPVAGFLHLEATGTAFGIVDVGARSQPITVELRNGGEEASGQIAVAFLDGGTSFVVEDECSGRVLPVGQRCPIKVTFAPKLYGAAQLKIVASASPGGGAMTTLNGLGRDHVTLTVVRSGDGDGRIAGSGIDCGDVCTQRLARISDVSTVPLTATPGSGSSFGVWSGCTSMQDRSCTVVLDRDVTVRATFWKRSANLVFITSVPYTLSSLQGSIAKADATCNDHARAANLPGTYMAYVASGMVGFWQRIGPARGWIRIDGKPFRDRVDFIHTYYPPELDENAQPVPASEPLWSSPNGYGSWSCGGFTNSTDRDWFLAGDATGGDGGWNGVVSAPCNSSFRLICLGKDINNPLTIVKTSGRMAFLSDRAWAVGGGLQSADAHCQTEATGKYPGTFKALLATKSASAASRFDTSDARGPWVRPDGIVLGAKGGDFFVEGGRLLSAPQVTPLLRYEKGIGVWTGATGPRSPGTAESTCHDWTTPSGTLKTPGGRPVLTSLAKIFAGQSPPFSCADATVRLYCLEE